MITADYIFKELEDQRKQTTQKLMSGLVPQELEQIINVDSDCIWHGGNCIMDDPECRIMEEGIFLDPVRAKAFQCKGCQRLSVLSARVHQNEPVQFFLIENGLREGMRFRVQIEDCGHSPQIHYNALTKEVRTQKRVHDTLVHYVIQQILEEENMWNIERVYDTYLCGDKVISIREEPMINIDTFKVTKSFVKAGLCSLIQILIHLKPYQFIFGDVGKTSFIFNSIPCEGKLGPIAYKSKNSLKIKNFTNSSLSTSPHEEKKNPLRLVPDTPLQDAITRHSEARIRISHNHETKKELEMCKMHRLTFNIVGEPKDIERARHIHYSDEINFSLNVYLALCAFMTIPIVRQKMMEDREAKMIWTSIWPHGSNQANRVSEKLVGSRGTSSEILTILMKEDLYLEPFEHQE